MHIGRLIGWILLVSAFVFAAAEVAAQGVAGEFGILGAVDVLDILAPDLLDRLVLAVRDGIHPFAWDPVLLTLMALPGWLITGVPGAALAWKFRTPPIGGEEDDNLPYTTYEDIVAAAEEEQGLQSEEPSKYKDLHEFDPTDAPDEPHGFEGLNALPLDSSDIANFRQDGWLDSVDEQVGSSYDQDFDVLPIELSEADMVEKSPDDPTDPEIEPQSEETSTSEAETPVKPEGH